MMKNVAILAIVLAFVFSIILNFTNIDEVSAIETYKTMNFKLAHGPTICAIEPDENSITDAGKTLLEQTRYAVIDWQTKLKEATHSRNLWNINFVPISLDQKKGFDYSKCDIEVYFEREPQEEGERFGVLGVASLDSTTSKPIVTIYYLQIDPNIEYNSILAGNVVIYWYEEKPSYLNYLRTDDQLASVIRHEIGHAMGIGHYMIKTIEEYNRWKDGNAVPPSIMIPITPEFAQRLTITPVDMEKLISIYGYDGFGGKPSPNSQEKTMHTIPVPYSLKLYNDESYQFSIGYPEGWYSYELQRESPSDPIVVFYDDSINYAVDLSVLLDDTHEDKLTGQEYVDALTKAEKKRCSNASLTVIGYKCANFDMLDSKEIKIGGKEAYQLRYYWDQNVASGEAIPIVELITEIPIENEVWQIRAEIIASVYSDYIGEVESSINSFTLTTNEVVSPQTETTVTTQIPIWIKNNAKWWVDGMISDSDFVQGIQYLIKEKIMQIPQTQMGGSGSQQIPSWIKNNAKWWAEGQISDDDFISGIQYLISNGIMKV